MDEGIRQLVELQAVDLRVAALEAEITALPRKLAEQASRVAAASAQVAKVEESLKNEEKQRRRLQDDVRTLRDKADKFRAQTNSVKTNEQLHALQHEIAFAENAIRETEDREIASMETTERLEADLTNAQNALRDQQQKSEWEKASANKVSERAQRELKDLRAQRESLRQASDPGLLASYDRLAKARRTAIAEVRDQECQGCHVKLRPAQWQHLRGGERMNCESCGRMLYYDEANDTKLAAKAAGRIGMP